MISDEIDAFHAMLQTQRLQASRKCVHCLVRLNT